MKFKPIKTKNRLLTSALIGLGMTAPMPASALMIDINTYVTGSIPGTEASVANLILTQNGNNVDFTFNNTVNNLPGGIGNDAFISQLQFSYEGAAVLTNASFSNFGGTQAIVANDFDIDPNGKNAGYNFYLDLGYPTSSVADRFVDGEVTTWTISGVSLNDFLASVPGSGQASLAMVHIQQVGAGPEGGSSLKYVGSVSTPPIDVPQNPVPEPGSLALMGIGLLGLGAMRRHKK